METTSWTRQQLETVLVEVSRRSADPAFRQQIMSDPKKTIESLAGRPVPANLSIRVIEKLPNTITITLPEVQAAAAAAAGELSDKDLEQVAGGRTNPASVNAGGSTTSVHYDLTVAV